MQKVAKLFLFEGLADSDDKYFDKIGGVKHLLIVWKFRPDELKTLYTCIFESNRIDASYLNNHFAYALVIILSSISQSRLGELKHIVYEDPKRFTEVMDAQPDLYVKINKADVYDLTKFMFERLSNLVGEE